MVDPLTDPSATSRVRGLVSVRAFIWHLRSPRSDLVSRFLRYCFAGTLVTVVYLTTTTVLSQVVGLRFEVALAIGFISALLLHFALQRFFVWRHHDGFALPMQRQVSRYLAMVGTQYVCTAASTAVLPSVLGLPTEIVYLGTIAILASTSFLIMRFVIFHSVISQDQSNGVIFDDDMQS